ncbi:unnamed protein product [Chrysodeixis includens]|uniref:Uncharacterized protein n=1 Tax=Chrysodeixis includens TaxID=689277 RepID=A0A9P0BWK6_CHRIL|nr:unnamed protein product [Chrysodeixis includens]
MNFIYHFAGGSPESNQYFFDLQNLLKTEAPTEDDPNEDPCDPEEDDTEIPDFEIAHEKTWWEDLESDRRPFIMYGDMSEFNPTERRSVLKRVKAAKTAPKKWKSYVFNDVVFKPHCENLDDIKDTYLDKVPVPNRTFECMLLTPEPNGEKSISRQQSLAARERREHQNTADVRHKMGSILKIMTAQSPVTKLDPTNTTKTALLGARDSMEIASTTKLARISIKPEESEAMNAPVRVIEQHEVLAVGRRRVSAFDSEINPESDETAKPAQRSGDDEEDERISLHASMKNDSLEVIGTHVPDVDHTIYYERVCPIEKCQRMQVDSFMRSLPAYMRAHPFTHFSHTFEGYETCTPEQLDILKQRIESKKAKEVEDAEAGEEDPLREWTKRGVAVQTSDLDVLLPPCTCHVPSPTPVSSNFVFNIDDLMPVKEAMDAIHKECLFDDKIDFNRFKVVGSESETSQVSSKSEFKPVKIDEIKRILVENPSLLDVFNPDSGAPQMT